MCFENGCAEQCKCKDDHWDLAHISILFSKGTTKSEATLAVVEKKKNSAIVLQFTTHYMGICAISWREKSMRRLSTCRTSASVSRHVIAPLLSPQ